MTFKGVQSSEFIFYLQYPSMLRPHALPPSKKKKGNYLAHVTFSLADFSTEIKTAGNIAVKYW